MQKFSGVPKAGGLFAFRAWAFVWLLAACDESVGRDPEPASPNVPAVPVTHSVARVWKLPKVLREVSGLAFDRQAGFAGSHPDLLYAVADEQALIVAINGLTGDVESVFSLGNPPLPGDFEGIAVAGDQMYLVTSDGILLQTRGAADGGTASYDAHDLQTRSMCEIEGLAAEPLSQGQNQPEYLWIACKQQRDNSRSRGGAGGDVVRLYAWSTTDNTMALDRTIELDKAEVLAAGKLKGFSPSGIIFRRAGEEQQLLLIAGAQGAYGLWVWQRQPKLIAAGRLPSEHRQAEGLEIGPRGELFVADEGGKKRARLRVYPASGLREMPF